MSAGIAALVGDGFEESELTEPRRALDHATEEVTCGRAERATERHEKPRHRRSVYAVEAGREYNTVDMSTSRLYNDYLPPYKAAVKAGGHRTKKEAVTAALREYVRYRQQLELLRLAGQIDYDTRYDHKAERHDR